ncbi:DUF1903-domain-containing protein, partial [Flagelloscypha sp. PMI_526]
MPPSQSCQAQACDLQSCLNKNAYTPENCEAAMRKLYTCCQSMYEKNGPDAESTACPMNNVVKRWLKAHPDK